MARTVQKELVTPALTKDDRSPVTVGDFAVQAVVARRLAEQLPGASLIGEESAEALRLEEGIDTLDQLTEFVRRVWPSARRISQPSKTTSRRAGQPFRQVPSTRLAR